MSKKEIYRVKCLGVRTQHETKVFFTYNSTIYCIVVEYTDGSRELLELEAKKMGKYLEYIDMD